MYYNEFIQSIINTRGQWGISKSEYFEKHHILPLCQNGTGDYKDGKFKRYSTHSNCIWLYPQEHYEAHRLLAEENPTNRSLVFAWSMMAFPKGKTKRDYIISADEYARLVILQSNLLKENNPFLDENGHPANYGKPLSEEQKLKLSEARKGKPLGPNSSKTKQLKSEAQKKRYIEHPETFIAHNKDKRCITNGNISYYINPETELLPDGFWFGCTMSDDNTNRLAYWTQEKRLEKSNQVSGCNNPMYGKGEKLSGGKNGHAIYNYIFEGITYDCRDALMIILKSRWPDISESTIRKIMSNKYTKRISNKFQYVIDNLSWKLKNEN